MKLMFLANNWVGWQIAQRLAKGPDETAALVLHAPEKQTYGDEIRQALDLKPDRVFHAPSIHDPGVLKAVADLGADMAVSVFFGTILKPAFLNLFPKGCINIHPALLPFNRGAHPNVWSIVEGTPAGATIHFMDEGVDTGRIIAQKRVRVRPIDTGKTLYRRLERACLDLFDEAWPRIREGRAEPSSIIAGNGSFHKTTDLEAIQEIKPDSLYTARELVDILRARTFEPHPGAFMEVDGKKVFMRLELYYGEDDDQT